MTENEKAKELIATSETTVKVNPQNGWYLKRFAALQFEGSVDNFSTNMPIHVLEQQLPKDDTMKLDDAVIEGQDFDYSKFYDERGNEYSSVSELVQTLLDLDDDDSIQEYNEENPDLPYIPYEKLREMDKKDIPELLLSVADEADYVDAYKEVSDIESWNVEVTPMSNNYETMGFAFTHQGLKEYEKSIDNHIFHFCRTYAYAGEQHNRREGDFYPIMEFLHSAGEQLLVDDLKRFDVKVMELATAEEMPSKKKVSILPSKSTSMGGLTRCALPTLGATTTGCFSPLRMKQRSKLPQTRWRGCRITLSVSASVTRTLSATFSVRLPSTSTAPNALLTTRRQKSPKSRSTSRSSKACRKGKTSTSG